MKSNFKLETSEIKRILEMHNKENLNKKVILEQSQNLQEQLQALLDNKCFPRGVVYEMPYTGNFNYAIRVESKNTPGKYRYFFIDRSVYEYDDDATKKNFHTVKTASGMDGRWVCDAGQERELQAKLADLKTREGWVEYSELESKGMSRQGADQGRYGEPKIFDLGNGKKVKLYKAPGKEGVTATGYTPEQNATIERYKKRNYKLRDELTNDEMQSWKFQQISIPGLPDTWGMYYDPSAKETVDLIASDKEIETELTNQDYSLKSCKQTLNLYYTSFKTKKVLKKSNFDRLKEKTQACVNQYEYKGWGGLRPGYFKDMVQELRGLKRGGPSAYGDDAKWRLQ